MNTPTSKALRYVLRRALGRGVLLSRVYIAMSREIFVFSYYNFSDIAYNLADRSIIVVSQCQISIEISARD